MTGRVIVGVDGSTASRRALRWAADYAAATHAPLEAVVVWEMPATYGWIAQSTDQSPTEAVAKGLESVIDEVVGSTQDCTSRVARGHPAHVLVQASKRADLLVLGSRGMGGFTGMLLGSVSNYCVHHADCPVVVLRDEMH